MFTWVIGLPVPLCVGMAFISTVEVFMAGRSAPPESLVSSGFEGGAFVAVLLDIERWGMSFMLL